MERAWGAALTLVAMILLLDPRRAPRASEGAARHDHPTPTTTDDRADRRADDAGARCPPAADRPRATAGTRRPAATARGRTRITLRGLNAFYGDLHAVKDVDPRLRAQQGHRAHRPVGLRASRRWCAASTACTRRSRARAPRARSCSTTHDVYGDGVDVVAVRRAIGMVFQKPNPFPTMSIFDNVAAGLQADRHARRRPSSERVEAVAARRRAVGRGQGPPRRAGHRALGRPAAAPVHRAGARRRARGRSSWTSRARRSTRSPR